MKEEAWGLIVVVVDLAEGRVKCTRLYARSVRRNAMFRSSRAGIVRFIVKNVSQSGKMLAARRG
jgi:hypothetical protein